VVALSFYIEGANTQNRLELAGNKHLDTPTQLSQNLTMNTASSVLRKLSEQ
jgi:hypothetical protein